MSVVLHGNVFRCNVNLRQIIGRPCALGLAAWNEYFKTNDSVHLYELLGVYSRIRQGR